MQAMHDLITTHTPVVPLQRFLPPSRSLQVHTFQEHGTEALDILAGSQDPSCCALRGNDPDHRFSHSREKGKGNTTSSTAEVGPCFHLLQ